MYLHTFYTHTVFDIIDPSKTERVLFIYQFYFISVTFSSYFKYFPFVPLHAMSFWYLKFVNSYLHYESDHLTK